MPLSIEQVITPTTAAEIETEILSLCATGGLPTSSWQVGSVVRTIIAEVSEVIYQKSIVETEIARGGLGDLASPEWAKLWAQQIYNVLFVPAAAATGVITATNTSVSVHTLDAGELIVAHSITGKTYRNQAAIVIPASGSLANIAIAADEVGITSNAAPGQISTLVNTIPGLSVTNPAAVLGADEETTVALVARTRAKLGSLSPLGPKDAYNYVIQTPELCPTSTPITRSRTTAEPTTGQVVVFAATASGAPTAPDIDICNEAIWEWAEPWAVSSIVQEAIEVDVDITYRVWIDSSLTVAQIESAIALAITQFLAGVPVGGVVVPPDAGAIYTEALTYVIHTCLPGIKRVQLTLPAADIMMNPYDVPVLGVLTPTVTLV